MPGQVRTASGAKAMVPGGLQVKTASGVKVVSNSWVLTAGGWKLWYQDAPVAVPSVAWTNMGAASNTITLGWGAATRAVSYNVYLAWTGQAKYLYTNQTALSFVLGGMGSDTNHSVWVAAVNSDGVEGPHSAQMNVRSGHPQVSKTGSLAYEARPTATATYRPLEGNWSYNADDVVQGYYSASNANGFGVITYDGAAFRNWVTANYGADVLANLAWNSTKVAMYRNSTSYTGAGAAVAVRWHVTGSVAGQGGQPALAGGEQGSPAQVPGNAAWVTLPYAHWGKHVLMNENLNGNGGVYVVNSFCIQYGGTADYAKFEGMASGGNVCSIQAGCSWNFVSVAYAPTTAW